MSTEAASDLFKNTTMEFFEFMVDLIALLNEGGYSGLDPSALDLPRGIISAFPAEELTGYFLDCHDAWVKIQAKDSQFILETVPATYAKIPFDVNLLTVPLAFYIQWVKNHPEVDLSREPEVLDQDSRLEEWPIRPRDIRDLWEYFFAMVELACQHVQEKRRRGQFLPEFPLADYQKMFGFA